MDVDRELLVAAFKLSLKLLNRRFDYYLQYIVNVFAAGALWSETSLTMAQGVDR